MVISYLELDLTHGRTEGKDLSGLFHYLLPAPSPPGFQKIHAKAACVFSPYPERSAYSVLAASHPLPGPLEVHPSQGLTTWATLQFPPMLAAFIIVLKLYRLQ